MAVPADVVVKCHSLEELVEAARRGEREALFAAVDELIALRASYAADRSAFADIVSELRDAKDGLRGLLESSADELTREWAALKASEAEIEARRARLERVLLELFRDAPRRDVILECGVLRRARVRDVRSGRTHVGLVLETGSA